MHIGKLMGSSSRYEAHGRRWRWLGATLLGLGLCGGAAAQAASDATVPTSSALGIPLFTADPRPSPMGPAHVAPAAGRHANILNARKIAGNAELRLVPTPTRGDAASLRVAVKGPEVAAFR
ncbi:hypothetical protein [Pseudacidovorax sp. RU35E]|uniref:hypothetical protein n=1 Tax=Pseudacidovorax sp. RU35E TaxID=1907403 RepID=UPI0009560BCE|nr:hypothetical protein [Pseudacidovorax sp. RU35E]SIQ49671.1 hypothetical protein SAMN05880557_10468 [Pseudacidovorax sp. RU35E]